MTETKVVSGLVATILNDREIVINIGEEAGVTLGMRFKVFDPLTEVKDPKTREVLGTVRREKVRVKVTSLQPKLCVARTYETYRVNVGGSGIGFSPLTGLFDPLRIETRVRTLRQDDSQIDYGPLDASGSYVKVGDPVESTTEE